MLPISKLLLLFSAILVGSIGAFPTDSDLSHVEAYLSSSANRSTANLIELISIPSVSADPSRASEVRRCAEWLREYLDKAGLNNAQLVETPGHPLVYADWLNAEDAPTVLVYGHYDVQPEDPVSEWDYGPFSGTINGSRIYGRGASDDKGPLWNVVVAVEAWLKTTGKVPVNVKLVFEGEEEVGSMNLKQVMMDRGELFQADYAFSADGGMVDVEWPSLTLGLRGVFCVEVTLTVGESDMHSGQFGGGVRNPIVALSKIVDSLFEEDGRIAVKGYYDDVDTIGENEKKWASDFPISSESKLEALGVIESVGETGFSFYERTWYRPSLEIVGMWGGFTGQGMKTVLPREAHAKIAARTVMSQSSGKMKELVIKHLMEKAQNMSGVSLQITSSNFEAEPFRGSLEAPGNKAAAAVLESLYERPLVYQMMGGTIPVLCMLRKMFGLETTMFAFAHADERVHAPNEFGRLDSFRKGEVAYARLLMEVWRQHGKQMDGIKQEL